ncbi:MAG: hypothetical protein WD554_06030 [Flavobacteriaceae bacterium]
MKNSVFIFLVFILSSCDIQYEGNTRLLVTGEVVGRNGSPLSGVDVIAKISQGSGFGSRKENIGITTTDEQGVFKMLFPKPKGEIDYTIHFLSAENYQEKRFVNIFYEDFNDYAYRMGETTLYKNDDIVNLDFSFNQINPQNNITELNVIGMLADYLVWVNPNDEQQNYVYYSQYQVAKNQTLVLEYIVHDFINNQNTSHSETIVIEEQNVTYTITY